MPAPEIAVAYVSIVPSLQGFQGDLRRQMVSPAANAGQDAGEGFSGGFKGAAFAGALAIGAGFAKLMGQALEQANVTSKLQAQLGATSKDAGRYGKVAGQLLAKGVVDNFEEGAESIRAVVNGGLVKPDATNKQLESIATKMSDVARTFGTDMGMQTQAVSAMLKNGLAPDADAALDVIATGFQKLGPNADDLLETFQEYSVQLKKLGLDSETSLGLFSQGLKGGARDTDIIADAFKEFSIRAIDGSKGTAAAYKSLGLDMDTMSAKIGKGGKSATGGLDTVLDRLRAMKDPVAREAAAVGLFGTQAEDLGTALFSLDPSKAVGTLGKVGGAAKRMGDTLRSGPQYEFQTMIRTVQQDLVGALVKYGIPALMGLIDTVKDVARWGKDAFAWVRDNIAWIAPFALAILGVTVALNAQAIATGIVTGIMTVYRGVMLIGIAVTNGMAAAHTLLNAVMSLNPFTLIVLAILAFVGVIVLAYQKSETFRQIVQSAWQGIQDAALYAWNNVLKPVFDGFMSVMRSVGDAAMWLWNNAIKPAFAFIDTAARILLTLITVVVFGPIYLAVLALGAVFSWLWTNAVKPAFDFIAAAAVWLWENGVKPVVDSLVLGLQVLGDAFVWLWKNAVKPAVDNIARLAVWLWNNGVKPVWGYFKEGIRALGAVFGWLYEKGVRPALRSVADIAKWLWEKGVKPSFDLMKRGVKAVGDSFNTAKDYIGKQWKKVEGLAKAPIKFIVDVVYNGGIVPMWNKVAKAFGAPTLKTLKFASGGVMPGYTPGRDPHKFYSPTGGGLELSGGESIFRPEFTRAVGAGWVHKMNATAKSGGVGAVRNALGGDGSQRFADGGIFGWIKGVGSDIKGVGSDAWEGIKKGASWLGDTIESSARAGVKHVVNPLLSQIPGADSGFGQMARGIPTKIVDSIFGYSKESDKKMEAAGIGGKGTQAALRWARTQNGKRYQWGGNGNPSWDCSGLTSAIESVIRGQKPHRRWATGSFSGSTAPPGWVRGLAAPYRIGITNSGVGHTAGTLNGVNVESRGGDGVVIGSRARGYNDSMFTDWYGFAPSRKYDSGGWLQPGATMSVNKTGSPEAILTAAQWRSVTTLASSGGGGLQPGDRLVLVAGGTELEAYVDRRADARIESGLVGPADLGRNF